MGWDGPQPMETSGQTGAIIQRPRGSKLNDGMLGVFSPWRHVETNVRVARGAHSENWHRGDVLTLGATGSVRLGDSQRLMHGMVQSTKRR